MAVAGIWGTYALYFSNLPWEWRREVATLPRATISGDKVRLTGFRNFKYRSHDDFTEHYEEREVSLDHLSSVDLFLSYWTTGPVGHTFVSFNCDNAPPVCISIETRPEEGEGFAPIASIFKGFELFYAVGDERDLVRVRTNHRDEEVYLYKMKSPPEAVKRLFLVYLERINEVAESADASLSAEEYSRLIRRGIPGHELPSSEPAE